MKQLVIAFSLILTLLGCKNENRTEENQMENRTKTVFDSKALSQDLVTLDGNVITLEKALQQHKGKIVLIDVWASWCPDCIEGMPKLHKLQKDFQNVVYLFLSYDKTEESWKYGIEKYKVIGEHFLIHSDWKTGEFRETIDLDWIPRYILVDQKGKIAHYRAIEADDPELIAKIKELR